MTARPWHNSDDFLLDELRNALGVGGGEIPPRWTEAARAAFVWRGVDEELELLILAHDSLLKDRSDVRNAAWDRPRTLTFDGNRLSVEVEVDNDIMGQLVPPQRGRIRLITATTVLAEVEADAMGCFRLPRPQHGPVRLLCETDGSTSATDWVAL